MNPFLEIMFMLVRIYTAIVLLRFFLQYFRADYYNPLSQFVIKTTDPLIRPLRRVIPGFGGIDISSLFLAWMIGVASMLLVSLYLGSFAPGRILLLPLLQVATGCFDLFMFLVFMRAILSWFASPGYNPVFALLGQLTEPLLSRCRRLLPAMSGIDLSPIIALFGLMLASRLIEYYLFPLVS